VVVDDVDMRISHVIRGDDHVSNTPKHVLLFEALGVVPPVFAHVPLILGADKKRLSKRHGATSVTEYQRQGYLPDAMVNFLALLGWSPGGDRELLSVSELVESFSLEGISGGHAVFNTEKLDWMNGQYIARMPIADLVRVVEPFLAAAGLFGAAARPTDAWLFRLVDLLRPRAKRLGEFAELARPFLADAVDYEPEAVEKHLSTPGVGEHILALAKALETTDPFDEPSVESAVRSTATERDVKAGVLIHATRVALTGRTTSPGIFEVLVLFGRDRSVGRLEQLAAFVAARLPRPPVSQE
jgi:glutamyl-tRNA synthetase